MKIQTIRKLNRIRVLAGYIIIVLRTIGHHDESFTNARKAVLSFVFRDIIPNHSLEFRCDEVALRERMVIGEGDRKLARAAVRYSELLAAARAACGAGYMHPESTGHFLYRAMW